MVDLKNIDPRHVWYIVGFIATDGHLSKDARHINITSKDRSHIVKIRAALKLNNKIGRKTRSTSHAKIYFQLQFGDVRFYKYLIGLGFVQNKSCNLGPLHVDPLYFIDFLRGVVDGDGCISTWTHRTNGCRQWSLRISSAAPQFIDWLKEKTEKHFDVRGRLYHYQYSDKKNLIYILKFGKLPTKVIIKSIYYKGALSLDRKNLKTIVCLNDKNKMINYADIVGPGAGIGRQSRLKIE